MRTRGTVVPAPWASAVYPSAGVDSARRRHPSTPVTRGAHDVRDPVADPRPGHGEGPHDRRLPDPGAGGGARVTADPRSRARRRRRDPHLPVRPGGDPAARERGSVHAPDVRGPGRGWGARDAARLARRARVHARRPGRRPVLRRAQGRRPGRPRRNRRVHRRLHPGGGARRPAGRAGLGSTDRRGDRCDGPRDPRDLCRRRALAGAHHRDVAGRCDLGRHGAVPRDRCDQGPRGCCRVPGGVVGGRPTAQRPLTPDPGLYGPGSEAWRLNREAALLLGAGPRALLMQIAHPLVAEGVDQHSDFRADPWTRLAGTLRSYLRIVYGNTAQARGEIRRLNGLHRSIAGPVRDPEAASRFGGAYEARDPALSLWVHATLVDSTLATVDAWLEPLAPERRARFYAETMPIGRLFGVPDGILPPDVDAFDAYVAGMLAPDGPIHPTPVARELAGVILHPPLGAAVSRGPIAGRLGPVARPLGTVLETVPPTAVSWLLVPAIGLLPSSLRHEYGLGWGTRERAIDAWLTTAWRAWRPILPEGLRWFPQALAADARMDAGG